MNLSKLGNERTCLPSQPQKFNFCLNVGVKSEAQALRLRDDYDRYCTLHRASRNVPLDYRLHVGTKIVGKMMLGGIIVVEAGSCTRVEIYASVMIEIHFHNYLTTARIARPDSSPRHAASRKTITVLSTSTVNILIPSNPLKNYEIKRSRNKNSLLCISV